MPHTEWTPVQWFEEAERSYLEKHQGCAWCGGANRVYRTQRPGRLEFYCSHCDFFACRDEANGRIHVMPGQPVRDDAPNTMHDFAF